MGFFSRRKFLAGAMGFPVAFAFSGKGTQAASTEHEVAITDFLFKPDRLEVKTGDTIRFVNHDLAPHTATADDGSWTTEELKRGDSEVVTVTADMFESYFCAFHPHMKAKLILQKS